MIITSRHQWVEDTPLLKVEDARIPEDVQIYAKCEFLNPAGGIKDRFGLYALDKLFEQGLLKEGMTLVEPTAGNTGLGFAFAAIGRGIELIFVVPEKFAQEKQKLMRALGASIVSTPSSLGMEGAIEKAKDMVKDNPKALMIDQFKNQLNAQAYYHSVAYEIDQELGQVDVFVAGAGTGGTFSGIAQYLKEKNEDVINVLADPLGSTLGGGEDGNYLIEGIGNHFTPDVFQKNLVDEVVKVSDDEAFSQVRNLARHHGIFVGSSSGANLEAAIKMAEKIKKGVIVTVFPDRGERYLSKGIYD